MFQTDLGYRVLVRARGQSAVRGASIGLRGCCVIAARQLGDVVISARVPMLIFSGSGGMGDVHGVVGMGHVLAML